jgi:hypothetical protein
MKTQYVLLACALCLLAPAMASAATTVEYSYAQIWQSNTTVDLIPSFSGSAGILNGIKCIFPSTDGGASVKITVTLDSTASSFTIDPTTFERESSLGGQFLSGWIPFNTGFNSSIHVQLNNTNLGTATINCWASWWHV